MINKFKFAALPLALVLTLGACSDEEASTPEEETAPAETEQAAEPAPSELDLPGEEDIVVVVNGEEIQGSVYNSVARQLEASLATQGQKTSDPENAEQVKQQAITVIVGNKLIIQDAVEKGHEADEETVDQRLEELKGQFESEEAMNEALERTGFTLEDMELQLRDQLIYESYVADELETAEVSDGEVQEAYDGYAEQLEGEAAAFEEMEPVIRQSLEEQSQQQAVYNRIEELRETAEIEQKI